MAGSKGASPDLQILQVVFFLFLNSSLFFSEEQASNTIWGEFGVIRGRQQWSWGNALKVVGLMRRREIVGCGRPKDQNSELRVSS